MRNPVRELRQMVERRMDELPLTPKYLYQRRSLAEAAGVLRECEKDLAVPENDRPRIAIKVMRAVILAAEGGLFGKP